MSALGSSRFMSWTRARTLASPAIAGKGVRSLSTSQFFPTALVSSSWVAKHLPNVKVVDGSWFVPTVKEDAYQNFLDVRLPNAQFFNVDTIADKRPTSKGVQHPHLFPTANDFSRVVGDELGISNKDNVVVYDSTGIFSAPRVWYTFKLMGMENVAVLDGGLPQWRREGYPIQTGTHIHKKRPHTFEAKFQQHAVKNYEDMLKNIDTKEAQVLDARSAGRFEGVEAEPRPNMKSGHIPGAVNVPFSYLKEDITGFLKPVPAIRAVFERSGVNLSNPNSPIICYCGSGVTACFVAFGLHLVGHKNISVYQGSWTEWGSLKDSPVETGPSKKH